MQQADEVCRLNGFDIKEALSEGQDKSISIKYSPDGVDIEALAIMKYQGIEFYLSNKINPGTDTLEEYNIWIKPKGSKDPHVKPIKMALDKGCHPGWSFFGVILEHPDGTITKIDGSHDEKTSYSYQSDFCEDLLKQYLQNGQPAPV